MWVKWRRPESGTSERMSIRNLFFLLTLMLASKGIAGVPRSSLVVLAATIPSFNIPVAGILLLMGIDHFLDMGRSAINVLGNGIATAMLSQNEGAREAEAEAELVKQEA